MSNEGWTWKISPKEVENFKAWNDRHLEERHSKGKHLPGSKEPYSGCIGGRISFIFTSTSLGQIVSVECGLCKTVENITDWEDFG